MNRRNDISFSPVLWASAFVIAALTVIQAGRLAPNPAFAGQSVTTDEGFSMVTASSGQGPDSERYDVLYVIDSNEETMFIYYIDNANTPATSRLDLKNGAYLPTLFNAAR